MRRARKLLTVDLAKLARPAEKDVHDNVGSRPYEGREIKGWPITVVTRGRVIV